MPVEFNMNVQRCAPGVRRCGRDEPGTEFEARLRDALDAALILAMLAAPLMLVGMQPDDAQRQVAIDDTATQVAQVAAP